MGQGAVGWEGLRRGEEGWGIVRIGGRELGGMGSVVGWGSLRNILQHPARLLSPTEARKPCLLQGC